MIKIKFSYDSNSNSNQGDHTKTTLFHAHPGWIQCVEKLLKMVANARKERNDEKKETMRETERNNVTKNCEIIKKYKKPPQRPCVSLPMS